jgi:hypothetical protein
MYPGKTNFEIDFRRLKIQFVELDFYNLIFQKSSTDQQGDSMFIRGTGGPRIP